RLGILSLLTLSIVFGVFTGSLGGLLLTLVFWLAILIELLARYYSEPTRRLHKNEFEKHLRPVPLEPKLERKLQENCTTGRRNVIAYSGYAPFAGAGVETRGWSFAIDMTKGMQSSTLLSREPKTPRQFTLDELYRTVDAALRKLDVNDVLEIEEKLYV